MANKFSELEQIIIDLIILIRCSFQVVHKLVIRDDFFHFTIANTKNIAELLDSFPFYLLNDLNHFSGHFCPQPLLIISRGSRKVLPTRSPGLNSGKGLLDVGPSSCLDLMKTVGTSGCVGLSPSEDEVGYLRGSE